MDFMISLKNELTNGPENVSVTENGALGYRTTGKALLDLNFAVSTLRQRKEWEIEAMFANACAENLDLAVTWLMMARDIRGGMGERRLFRVCFLYLAREFPEKAVAIVPLIAEYGRWDDVVDVFFDVTNGKVKRRLFTAISDQLNMDLEALSKNGNVSLLAKWLPSESTSSKVSHDRALHLALLLGVSPKQYRTRLSALRKRIDVVERKMSAQKWGDINYDGVPSKTNILYRDAFMKHDEARRLEFLDSLKNHPSRIKASALFPHEIVTAYHLDRWGKRTAVDDTLEALWKNLPNVFGDERPNIMVVADGSGSMMWGGMDNKLVPLDVANALAIYFAEKLSPQYKDKYITFSSRPQYVDLSGATTLIGKLNIALSHDEVSNTDIKKVFELILSTAVSNHLKQEELPETILILSDMEFDQATYGAGSPFLFKMIAEEFAAAGYQMPKLAFWNINSRTCTIPVRENDLGVTLVSGFSPSVMKMVMSGKLDPYEALLDMLNSDRYKPVRLALSGEVLACQE